MILLVSGATTAISRLNRGHIGRYFNPNSGNIPTDDLPWAVENGAFKSFDEARFFGLLDKCYDLQLSGCLFVVVPDKVGDAVETRRLFDQWAFQTSKYGYPLAFVLQDGVTHHMVPWEQIGTVFIGGSTQTFKRSALVRSIVGYAKALGKTVHWGRGNSRKVFQMARRLGCDSIDGSGFSKWSNIRIPMAQDWLDHHQQQPLLL